jgi:hypothetical protein
MTPSAARRWISYATCAWALAFAAPHTWWALGVSAGFPGGEDGYYLFMSSSWRFAYDLFVVFLSAVGFVVALVLLRPAQRVPRRWLPHTLAWIACALLSLRGLAGLIVDGGSDLIWWPVFLLGGILYGLVAWLARAPHVSRALANSS